MPAQSSSKFACLMMSSISREVFAVSLYSTGKGRCSPATISFESFSTFARVSSPYRNCEPVMNQNVIVFSFSMVDVVCVYACPSAVFFFRRTRTNTNPVPALYGG